MPEKLREHYGIGLPESAVVAITERHALSITETQMMPIPRHTATALTPVAQTDGSMIPVVETGPGAGGDSRKLSWKEAQLALVRRSDEIGPAFAVTLGDTAATGAILKQLTMVAGLNGKSRVHGLGDGAPWIAEQMECQFGAQGGYLIDFYHLCGYLAEAAKVCAKDCPDIWMDIQKERLKKGAVVCGYGCPASLAGARYRSRCGCAGVTGILPIARASSSIKKLLRLTYRLAPARSKAHTVM